MEVVPEILILNPVRDVRALEICLRSYDPACKLPVVPNLAAAKPPLRRETRGKISDKRQLVAVGAPSVSDVGAAIQSRPAPPDVGALVHRWRGAASRFRQAIGQSHTHARQDGARANGCDGSSLAKHVDDPSSTPVGPVWQRYTRLACLAKGHKAEMHSKG